MLPEVAFIQLSAWICVMIFLKGSFKTRKLHVSYYVCQAILLEAFAKANVLIVKGLLQNKNILIKHGI